MVDVIQVYKSREIFTKATYTPENRKRFHNLATSFESTQGYLDKETLVLPMACQGQVAINISDLVIIQDVMGWEQFKANEHIQSPDWFKKVSADVLLHERRHLFVFKQLNALKSFEIFKIRKAGNDAYELFVEYAENAMKIGIPERINHKICDLKQSKPIRYQINGKSDFTLSGRKARTFYEFDYVIEWLGAASKIEFKELNKIRKVKSIPISHAKLIDERKMLSWHLLKITFC